MHSVRFFFAQKYRSEHSGIVRNQLTELLGHSLLETTKLNQTFLISLQSTTSNCISNRFFLFRFVLKTCVNCELIRNIKNQECFSLPEFSAKAPSNFTVEFTIIKILRIKLWKSCIVELESMQKTRTTEQKNCDPRSPTTDKNFANKIYYVLVVSAVQQQPLTT